MKWAFIILSVLVVTSSILVFKARNLIHSALLLALTFGGMAGLFILLGADFIGLAQVLIYIGAVAILIVFAMLLTRSAQGVTSKRASGWWLGLGIAAMIGVGLLTALLASREILSPKPSPASATSRKIGEKLMSHYVVPLEVTGLLLTAALLGGVLLSMNPEKERRSTGTNDH